MNKKSPLLPVGLYDLLPMEAERESKTVGHLLGVFSQFGYEQVSPPLLEFETNLLAGRGAALAGQTFRVLDPISHTMMGIRADMTLQVARIAVSRLANISRPSRLCYAGPILQSRSEPLRSERQLTQAGIELIGSDALAADAEIIIIAAESLASIGIRDISIDLNLPGLVGELCPEARDNPALQTQIKDAVMRKSTEMIAALPIANSRLLASLSESAGPADKVLAAMQKLRLPHADSLRGLIAHIKKNCPNLILTIDPIEYHGFDYHDGISFSIFAKGLRHDLGRGGRYKVEGEHATGFTIYVTHLLRLLPETQNKKKHVLIPQDISFSNVQDLHKQGIITLYALTNDLQKEAKSLNISAMYSTKSGKLETI